MKVGIFDPSFSSSSQFDKETMQNLFKEKVVKQYALLLSLWTMGHMATSAIYSTYLIQNGMSLFQVNLCNSVFFSFLFLCEIPTGAFADIFGRKKAFVLACLFRALSEFTYGLSHTIGGFIISEIIAAVGFTFMNGALKAWLVDSLIHKGLESPDSRIFGSVKSITQITGIVFAIIGSYIGGYSMTLSWFLGGSTLVIAALVAQCIITEEYFVPKVFSWKKGACEMKRIAVSSIRYGTTDPAVRFILIITFIQIFSVQALNMYWQPFFGSHGVEKIHYGYIFGGMMAMLALGAYLASVVHMTGSEKSLIIKSQVCVGVVILLVTVLTDLPLLVTFFLLHEVGRGYWEPMKDSYLHKRIPSHERATIDSFCSIAPHIGGTLGLLASGVIAQLGGITFSWVVSGSVLIVGALVVARNSRHADS
jgi:MFS family permease